MPRIKVFINFAVMKKLQNTLPGLMLIIMFALTGLSGCQIFPSQQPEQGDIDHSPRDRRIGVIQSLGSVKTSSQGTNLLIMDDGTTILLKSLAINLDDSKYLAKKVEVSGLLTYTTGDNKQIMEVESIDILDDAPVVTQQSAAVSWREYVNAGLGFSVKYRDDFTVDESGQFVTFTRAVSPDAIAVSSTEERTPGIDEPLEHTISLSATSHDSGKTLLGDVLKLTNDNPTTLLAAGISKSKIGLDGISAYKKISPESQSVHFYFDADGKFFEVSYQGGGDSQSIEDQNVFYDFLASFKLMNGTPATNDSDAEVDDTVNNVPEKTSPTAPTPSPSPAPAPTPEPEPDVTPAVTPTPSPEPVTESTTSVGATQELLPGYSSFTSTGYKFALQYPKSWYFGQSTTDESGVIRRYDFGSKPVDEEPGIVKLDIVSGSAPSGTSVTVDGKTLIQTTNGDTVSYYYKGENGRLYRVSGPSSMDGSLKNMISTIEEQ